MCLLNYSLNCGPCSQLSSQIKLDTDKEELKLWDCSNIGVEELGAKVCIFLPFAQCLLTL